MEQAELSQLSGAIRSAMGDSAGQFREAAERGNANLAKIMGTIAAAIKAQRQDLSDLQNVLQDNESVSERNSSTLQSIQSELQDINSGIHDIATGMKNMARGIMNVDNSIFRLNQDIQSSIGQSLLPGILTGLSGTATSIVKGIVGLAMGGMAFGGAKTAMEYMTGGAGSIGAGGPATGSFKEKAPMIMERLQKDFGVTKEQAAGVVGSLAAETGGFTKLQEEHPVAGRGGYGWAQWTGPRRREFEAFAASKGLNPSSDEANYQFLAHELRTSQSGELARLRQARTASEASQIFTGSAREGVGFLRPGAEHYGPSQRYAEKAMGIETSTASGIKPESSPMQSQTAQPGVSSVENSRVERIGAEGGHGPISGGAEHGGHTPMGKTAVTGKSLDGVNPALEKAFLSAAAEYKQKTGETVNVNSAKRSTEEQQILWEKKQRGEISYPVAKPGTSLHEKGLAIDVPPATAEKMDRMGILRNNGLNRPVANDPVHIQLAGTRFNEQSGPTMQEGGARPEAVTPMTSVTPGVMGGITPEQMAIMTGGMNPAALAATSAMMAQLQSAQIEAAAIAPQQQTEQPQAPQDTASSQILEQLSRSSENTQILQQAAVSKQAQQEISQQEPLTDIIASLFGQQSAQSSTVVNNNSNVTAGGYNGINDIGWPDWAEMIGGNHWKEMKNYKKNMWG